MLLACDPDVLQVLQHCDFSRKGPRRIGLKTSAPSHIRALALSIVRPCPTCLYEWWCMESGVYPPSIHIFRPHKDNALRGTPPQALKGDLFLAASCPTHIKTGCRNGKIAQMEITEAYIAHGTVPMVGLYMDLPMAELVFRDTLAIIPLKVRLELQKQIRLLKKEYRVP